MTGDQKYYIFKRERFLEPLCRTKELDYFVFIVLFRNVSRKKEMIIKIYMLKADAGGSSGGPLCY